MTEIKTAEELVNIFLYNAQKVFFFAIVHLGFESQIFRSNSDMVGDVGKKYNSSNSNFTGLFGQHMNSVVNFPFILFGIQQ